MPLSGWQATPKGQSALLSIPVFPPIAIRLLQLVSNEEVALGPVIELLEADPAFSAEILRCANSAAYAMPRQIKSLQHALVVLGLRRVRTLTLTVASGMYLKKALGIGDLRRCWRHTLACALLTEELSRACAIREDQGYTAGLMHDLGRLGLLVSQPAEFEAFLKSAQQRLNAEEGFDLLDYEHEVFGIDHCAAGNWLCEHWKLPPELQVVTGRHHDGFSGREIDLLGLVQLGCQLADGLGFDMVRPRSLRGLDDIRAALPDAARRRLHPDADSLREFVEMRINALDVTHPDLATRRSEEAGDSHRREAPAIWAPPGARNNDRKQELSNGAKREAAAFTRDIIVAAISSILAAGVFFLLVRLFSGG